MLLLSSSVLRVARVIKKFSSGNVLTSVKGVAVVEMDGWSTSSVSVVHDSGAPQRDPIDDDATMYLDRSAVSTLAKSDISRSRARSRSQRK